MPVAPVPAERVSILSRSPSKPLQTLDRDWSGFSVKHLHQEQLQTLFLKRRANPMPTDFLLPGTHGATWRKRNNSRPRREGPARCPTPLVPVGAWRPRPGKRGRGRGAGLQSAGSGRAALASAGAGVLGFRPDAGPTEMNELESHALSAPRCFCRAAGP